MVIKLKGLIPILLLLFTSVTAGCNNKESDELEVPVRIVNEESGTFSIDRVSKRPCVSVSTPGTIDVVSIYLLSNPPSRLPTERDEVIITGTARPSKQLSQLGGFTYYEMRLEKMVIKE